MNILVANMKGGVSKTTTSIVLSSILDDVLLIDGTQDTSLTSYYQVPAEARNKNICSILFDKKKITECIYNSNGTNIIPGSIRTADDTLFQNIDLTKKIGPLPYKYVIIDSQPSLAAFTRTLINFADVIIIPTTLNLYSVELSRDMAANARNIKPGIKIYILPTIITLLSYILPPRRKTRKILNIYSQGATMLPDIRYSYDASTIDLYGRIRSKRLLNNYRKAFRGVFE